MDNITLVFDIDGTICPLKNNPNDNYADLVPYARVVEKIRYYHDRGAKIVLYTSRNMNTYKGNIGLINKNTAPVLLEWLSRWNIPYDEIVFGKVWPGKVGFYVDDRAVRPDEFLNKSMDELLKLCSKSNDGEKNE